MERAQAAAARADRPSRQRQDRSRLRRRGSSLILYLDTDALVKLLVEEPGTDVARRASEQADILTTSHLSYVETRSALARMRAGRRLTASEHEARRVAFEELWADIAVQRVSGETIAEAADLAEKHTLRAYDALQLASALATEEVGLSFACWDNDLRAAAGGEGLDVIPPLPGERSDPQAPDDEGAS